MKNTVNDKNSQTKFRYMAFQAISKRKFCCQDWTGLLISTHCAFIYFQEKSCPVSPYSIVVHCKIFPHKKYGETQCRTRVPCNMHVIIIRIACIPTIPAIFDINTLCWLLISTLDYDFLFKFLYNFCGDCRWTCNLLKFEIPALGFPRKDPVNPCKHLQCEQYYDSTLP